jgi:hypothetical protein
MSLTIFLLLSALAANVAIAAPTGEKRAVELTFLKSHPGQREQLKTFIVRNWFAMDKIAKDQGLMHAYTVMDTGSDDGSWNVLVSVTYTNDRGYDGIAAAFDKVRQAHTTVLVDGKGLRELGAIVETRRVFEDPAPASP